MKEQELEALCHPFLQQDIPLNSRAHKMRSLPSVFVKREDELGGHGSKWRKYASILPWIQTQTGGKKVALVGSPYSNHILLLVQRLKQEGLPYRLFLTRDKTAPRQGNALFLSFLTQEKEIIWVDAIPHPLPHSWTTAWENSLGEEFTWIPLGGAMPQALPGALTLALDIRRNERFLSSHFSHIFVDAGTGLSAIGLLLGFDLLERQNTTLHVVSMCLSKEEFELELSRSRSFLEEHFIRRKIPSSTPYEFLFPPTAKSFGSINQQVCKVIKQVAREEGIFLDPIYTSKLFLAVKKYKEEIHLTDELLWIHSGGVGALAGFTKILS